MELSEIELHRLTFMMRDGRLQRTVIDAYRIHFKTRPYRYNDTAGTLSGTIDHIKNRINTIIGKYVMGVGRGSGKEWLYWI